VSESPWVDLITVEAVFESHQEAIRLHGGTAARPATAEDCVKGSLGSLGNAWSAALYEEPEEAQKGLCFAAHALVYLVRNHCFTDGNKRVAWVAAMLVLAQYRLTVKATTDEAELLVNQIITEDLDAGAVLTWLAQRLEWFH
jgi:death on curing protein